MDLRGDGHFVVPDACLQPTDSAPALVDQDVRHVLTFPNVLHAGVAFRVVAPLLVTFDYTFNRYVLYRSDVFVGSRGTTLEVPRDYATATSSGSAPSSTRRPGCSFARGCCVTTPATGPTPSPRPCRTRAPGRGRSAPDGASRPTCRRTPASSTRSSTLVTTTGTAVMPGTFDTRVWIASVGLTWHTELGGPR